MNNWLKIVTILLVMGLEYLPAWLWAQSGLLDETFGENGMVAINTDPWEWISDMIIQPDQKILIVTSKELWRFDKNGGWDLSFGNQKDGINKALRDYNTALKINPNFVQIYYAKSIINAWVFEDYIEAIKNRQIAIRLDHSAFLPGSLRNLGDLYSDLGFDVQARDYYLKAFQLDNDTVTYYNQLSWHAFSRENLSEAYQSAVKSYKRDSTNIASVMRTMLFSSFLKNDQEANLYAIKLVELFNELQLKTPNDWHLIGYTFWKIGKYEESEYYFNEQIKWCEESIRLNKPYAEFYGAHYDLACVLALRGETERAIELLNE